MATRHAQTPPLTAGGQRGATPPAARRTLEVLDWSRVRGARSSMCSTHCPPMESPLQARDTSISTSSSTLQRLRASRRRPGRATVGWHRGGHSAVRPGWLGHASLRSQQCMGPLGPASLPRSAPKGGNVANAAPRRIRAVGCSGERGGGGGGGGRAGRDTHLNTEKKLVSGWYAPAAIGEPPV
jgi:hypothetical protein